MSQRPHVFLAALPAMGHMVPLMNLGIELINRGCCATLLAANAEDLLPEWPTDSEVKHLRLVAIPIELPSHKLTMVDRMFVKDRLSAPIYNDYVQKIVKGENLTDAITGASEAWSIPVAAICTGVHSLSIQACLNAGLRTLLLADCTLSCLLSVGDDIPKVTLSDEEFEKTDGEPQDYASVLKKSKPGVLDLNEREQIFDANSMKYQPTRIQALAASKELFGQSAALVCNSHPLIEADMSKPFLDGKLLGRPVFTVAPLLRYPSTNPKSAPLPALLDRSEPGSVLYISFGTLLNPSIKAIASLARVLKDREQPFVWSLRRGEEVLPKGFVQSVAEFGVIVEWIYQPAVLAHPAVGWFLTHAGWNGTTESLLAGKPLIAWPMAYDQWYNALLLKRDLRLGHRFPASVICVGDADVDEAAIRETIDSAFRDQETRNRAIKTGEALRAALGKDGLATQQKDALYRFIVQDE